MHGARAGVIPVVNDTVWAIDVPGTTDGDPARAYGARLAALAAGQEAPTLAEAPVVTAAAGPAIASVSPTSASAGTGNHGHDHRDGLRHEGLTPVVRRCRVHLPVLLVDGLRPRARRASRTTADNANDIVSWTDTRIQVRVPTAKMSDGYDGSAGSGMVWVVTDAGATSAASPFAVTFGYGKISWASAPTFVVNNNCPGVTSASTAVANAAATWNAAVSGSILPVRQRRNHHEHRDRQRRRQPDLLAALERVLVGHPGGHDLVVCGSTITECDVKFNSGFTWTTGTASGSAHNVEAIMLHEFGHWLNLRDLYGYYTGYPSDSGKVMFGYSGAGFGNLNRRASPRATSPGPVYLRRRDGTPTPTPTATATPIPTTPVPQAPCPAAHVLPAQVEVENFDAGGEGVAYHDVESENLGTDEMRPRRGGRYRDERRRYRRLLCPGRRILNCSVDTTSGGEPTLTLRAANPMPRPRRSGSTSGRRPDLRRRDRFDGRLDGYGSFLTTLPFLRAGTSTHRLRGVDRINLDWLRLTRPVTTPTTTATPTPTVTATTLPTTVPDDAGGCAGPRRCRSADGPERGRAIRGRQRQQRRGDLADVVLLFNQLAWIGANEPPAAFDFNANGRIDF